MTFLLSKHSNTTSRRDCPDRQEPWPGKWLKLGFISAFRIRRHTRILQHGHRNEVWIFWKSSTAVDDQLARKVRRTCLGLVEGRRCCGVGRVEWTGGRHAADSSRSSNSIAVLELIAASPVSLRRRLQWTEWGFDIWLSGEEGIHTAVLEQRLPPTIYAACGNPWEG